MSPTRQAFNGATVECSQVFLFSPGENHMSVLFAFPSSSFTHTRILSTSLFFSPTRVLAFRYSLLCSLDTHTCDPNTLHVEYDISVLFALPLPLSYSHLSSLDGVNVIFARPCATEAPIHTIFSLFTPRNHCGNEIYF